MVLVPPVITRICDPVQELSFRIPYRNTEGKRQCILFPGLPDVTLGTKVLPLNVTIPPRSKFPLKVTIVA